jgi:hypothetical protein
VIKVFIAGLSRSRLHPNNVIRLLSRHQRSHAFAVRSANVRVGVQDQLAAVPVTLPFCDHLHVDAALV